MFWIRSRTSGKFALTLLLPAALVLSSASLQSATLRPPPVRRFELDSARTSVGFRAQATLGEFRGYARRITGWVEMQEPNYVDAHGEIVLQAASFQTGIGLRDRHLRETLETSNHPTIRFVLDSARFEQTDSTGENWYRLYGQLTIRNVTRRPELRARVVARADTLQVQGSLATRFTDFEMKPPTRMLGTTKVRNEFTIMFECTFVAAAPIGFAPLPQSTARPARE
ncbi:MAG: YceI family protein [Longimicrobiales bacterium]